MSGNKKRKALDLDDSEDEDQESAYILGVSCTLKKITKKLHYPLGGNYIFFHYYSIQNHYPAN